MKSRLFMGVLVLALLGGSTVRAQDPNACDEPGDTPDVVVGDLQEVANYGNVGDIFAYAVGTTSCNVGTCWLNWFSDTDQHPVIGQNMYRYKDGRLTQIGQSWLKHGFFALSQDLCSTDCLETDGTHLGVNCSDPYSAGLNGSQPGLGPRWEVNASTGEFPYPFDGAGEVGDAIYKRLQVHRDDLDPALNHGASYFVEGQYVAADDAQAGNGVNNNSFRPIDVDSNFNISLTGTTTRLPAIKIWAEQEPGVRGTQVDIVNDGRISVSARATENGDGTYHFEYAAQNITSDRSGQAFWIPVPGGSTVTGIGFHDVDYHSGEPFDNTDWVMFHDTINSRVYWAGDTFENDPNANALRWGTLYNFWFDIDVPSTQGSVFIDLFKPGMAGDPDTIRFGVVAPNACNNDGICQTQEICASCPNDCTTAGFCGDGVCEESLLEDCETCPSDCAGVQSGNPGNQYCCGNGGGTNPVSCSDGRCGSGGFVCVGACCGDNTCSSDEDPCICPSDCGPPPAAESECGDGRDEDCDGNTDCDDWDCCADELCVSGIDNDMDGVSDCDCDDSDPAIWSTPGETTQLSLSKSGGTTTLAWGVPIDPGGTAPGYETLRSASPDDFVGSTTCLDDPDPGDLIGIDTDIPPSGSLYQYLVRATNGCPDPLGTGTIGADSGSVQRPAAVCP